MVSLYEDNNMDYPVRQILTEHAMWTRMLYLLWALTISKGRQPCQVKGSTLVTTLVKCTWGCSIQIPQWNWQWVSLKKKREMEIELIEGVS